MVSPEIYCLKSGGFGQSEGFLTNDLMSYDDFVLQSILYSCCFQIGIKDHILAWGLHV